MAIPIADVLLRFAGSYPMSDDGLFETIDLLEENQTYPPEIAINTARFPMRVVAALLPELDMKAASLLAMACGQHHIMADPRLERAVQGLGEWHGETGPAGLRAFLCDIHMGQHPSQAAIYHRIGEDELYYYESILGLEQHWHDQVLGRVYFVRENYRGLARWYRTARELQTWRPGIIWSWVAAARRLEKELRSARAEPRR